MAECKWMQDEICVNAECPMRGDYCPVAQYEGVCRYESGKRGAIISGYQGIGKSTLSKAGNGYIDLESGNFFADGYRADDWYVVYSQIAIHLAEQGYRVFIW